MPAPRPPNDHAGFTLLEVLVALIVLALLLGAFAQIMQTGLRQSRTVEARTTATMLAQSRLAAVGIELPLAVGEAWGETEDGLAWRTAIELVEPPTESQPLAAYAVQVTVAWSPAPGDQVTLTTLRIGPPP